LVLNYPADRELPFNRPVLEPWWGAWEPILLGLVAILVAAALLLSWALLATVYFALARLIAFFADRHLDWRGSWRLASAALMPGALLLNAAIFFYGLGVVDLIRFLVLAVLHLVLGWIYLVVSSLLLPRSPTATPCQVNPFASPASEPKPPTPDKNNS
jgi:hypothetical protein